MRAGKILVLAMAVLIGFGAGCHKNSVDKGAFKSAINSYYSSRQECLWTAPIKLPAQVDTSNDEQTKGFDALTDAGLLTRKSAEKQRFLIGSKQVNDYDLSDKGRSKWMADQTQPGYGNFCFGHPEVTSIESYTPSDNADAAQYIVNYHYAVNLPDWANTREMRTGFPQFAADSTGQTGSASLTKSNDGWLVDNVQPPAPGGALPQ